MRDNVIITIGRQYGSGGHEIGMKLAERLEIPFYDNNLVSMAAKELDITEREARGADEKTLNNFLSSYIVGPGDYTIYMSGEDYMRPLNEQIYGAQSEIIQRLAQRSPCVIVGRCADFVLQDYQRCVSVFIHAEKDLRIQRVAELGKLSEKKAAEKVKKIDRERKYYYETNTGEEWGNPDNYQITVNSGKTGIKRAVDILEKVFDGMCE